MEYMAKVDFKDLLSGEEYTAGQKYPHEGEADAKRIQQLITPTTQRGALIEEVVEKRTPAAEPVPAATKRKNKEK